MIHMLRSIGEDKAVGRVTITARCGLKRLHRKSDGLPADFTGWEQDVTHPECMLKERPDASR